MTTQPITKDKNLEQLAAEALGGAPLRPPVLPVQAVAGTSMAAPAVMPPAVPTFDGLPPEVAARREKVARTRELLGSLRGSLASTLAAVAPLLADLADDAAELQAAEGFDHALAARFTTALQAALDGITAAAAPPARASKKSPAPKTDPAPEA